jgi:hypothetical protein
MITKLNEQGVRWFCDSCVSTKLSDDGSSNEKTAVKKLNHIESKIDALNESIAKLHKESTERVDKLNTSWADIARSNQGELAKEMKKALEVSSTTQVLIAKNLERSENESRALNTVLYGLPESDSSAMEQVENLMKKELFKDHNRPLQATRLGRKTPEKPRPIKLRFNNEKDKWEFLKRVNFSLREEQIFCKLDLSQQSRNKEFELRQRLRALKQSGNPTEYRIRNQKKRVMEWGNGWT